MSDLGSTPAPEASPSTPTTTSTPSSTGANASPTGGLPATQSQGKPPVEYFDVKSNHKTVKMTLDELKANASMFHASQENFQQAKKIQAEVNKIITNAKTNPIEALMDPSLGLTKDQIRDAFEAWYMKEFIEPGTLTEEQKTIRNYEQKLKKYEEEEKLKKETAQKEEETRLTNHQKEYLSQQIIEALESSGLPKIPWFASRMAFYMRQNYLNGWEAPLPMIISQVKKERASMMADMSQGSTAEQLIDILGEEVINKIRQHDLKQLRDKRQQAPYSGKANGSTPSGSGAKLTSSEVTRRLRDIRLGKL